jgi:hypothetical protein
LCYNLSVGEKQKQNRKKKMKIIKIAGRKNYPTTRKPEPSIWEKMSDRERRDYIASLDSLDKSATR